MDANLRRWVGLGGLLFVVMLIAIVALIASVPGDTASVAKVSSYYAQHKSAGYGSALLLEVAVVVGLSFLWYLRNLLVDNGADARLTTLGFAGAVIFGVSGAVGGGMKWVMADAVNHVSPATLQGLNAVQQDLNTILAGVGASLLLLPTGIAIIKSGAVARWLGWLAVVLGAVSLTASVGPLPVALWVLVTSIALLTSKAPAAAGARLATT